MDEAAKGTPKRKRGDDMVLGPLKFSFDPLRTAQADDGTNSPRTTVANRFQDLGIRDGNAARLGGGGVVFGQNPRFEVEEGGDESTEQIVKKQRFDEPMLDVEQPPLIRSDLTENQGGATQSSHGEAVIALQPLTFRQKALEIDSLPPLPSNVDTPTQNTPKKKRAGTPPLRIKSQSSQSEDTEMQIVDPVRAALTWHDDEISIYDPNDEDDDGTGINGVGFRPTAAIAHARVMKRRQQMAEYKRREESEARAQRTQRRRRGVQPNDSAGTPTSTPVGSQATDTTAEGGDKSPRKVRFMEITMT